MHRIAQHLGEGNMGISGLSGSNKVPVAPAYTNTKTRILYVGKGERDTFIDILRRETLWDYGEVWHREAAEKHLETYDGLILARMNIPTDAIRESSYENGLAILTRALTLGIPTLAIVERDNSDLVEKVARMTFGKKAAFLFKTPYPADYVPAVKGIFGK